jgi:hypothetical protein
MANGYSVTEMLDRIEVHILRVEDKVESINMNGCAHLTDHNRRMESLETWKRAGVGGVVTALLAALGGLVLAIVTHLTAWRH